MGRGIAALVEVLPFFLENCSIFIEPFNHVWYNYNRHRNGRLAVPTSLHAVGRDPV